MSAFALLKKAAPAKLPAPRTVEVPPTAWASDFEKRPTKPVSIGIRHISEADVSLAREEASKFAWERHREPAAEDDRIDAYNDEIMRWLVSRGTCQPLDSTQPWFQRDSDSVARELDAGGQRLIWEAIERLAIEESPIEPEATDDELGELAALVVSPDAWAQVDPSDARRARRLLGHVLREVLQQ